MQQNPIARCEQLILEQRCNRSDPSFLQALLFGPLLLCLEMEVLVQNHERYTADSKAVLVLRVVTAQKDIGAPFSFGKVSCASSDDCNEKKSLLESRMVYIQRSIQIYLGSSTHNVPFLSDTTLLVYKHSALCNPCAVLSLLTLAWINKIRGPNIHLHIFLSPLSGVRPS